MRWRPGCSTSTRCRPWTTRCGSCSASRAARRRIRPRSTPPWRPAYASCTSCTGRSAGQIATMSIERRIRRVLLALDDARPDVNVLRALQSLLDLDALEMTGLFLEDEELLRAALLPCFREISYA